MPDTFTCYHCGERPTAIETHAYLCPDSKRNRERMPSMSEAEFDKLIPVGEWAWDDEGGESGKAWRRDQYNLYHTPKIYDLERFALSNGGIALLESAVNHA